MIRSFAITAVVGLCLFALTGQAMADALSDAKRAYGAGDFAKAAKLYIPLAERGDADVQTIIGLMYSNGNGVPQSYKKAVKWYRMAAEQGNTDAQNWMGLMYENGHGVPQNYKEALKWYRLAAEQGNVHAQFNLAGMYEDGEGVHQDHRMAYMWANIATANSEDGDPIYRNKIAKKMTAQQIAGAQELARKCTAQKFKGC